jgi:hypothetical protein
VRKPILVINVIALMLALSTPLAIATGTPKAGASCVKINQKITFGSYIYQCVKSDKKLFWTKSVKVAKPSSTPTLAPTPISTLSPSIFDSSILWQRAAQQAFTYQESRSSNQLTLKVIQSPDFTSSNFSNKMESALKYSLTYWEGLSPKSAEMSLVEVNENDVAWATQELSALGSGAYDSYLFKNGQWNINGQSYSAGQVLEEYLPSSSGIPTFILFVGSQSQAESKLGQLTQSYHDAAHAIMFLNEGTNYVTNQPSCWFTEGHPSFYGFALSMGNEKVSMSGIRADQFQNTLSLGFLPPTSASGWLAFLIANESRRDAGCFKYALGYSIGTAMVEELILDFGPQKVNDWILAQGMAAGEWKNTFQSTFGISVDEWYAKSAVPYLMKTFSATNFEASS